MNTEPSSANPSGEPADLELLSVVEDYLKRYRQGERPSLTEYARRFPALGAKVLDLFPSLLLLEDVKRGRGEEEKVPEPEPERVSIQGGRHLAGEGRIRRLGDYRIVREIGRGGMGVVYEAEQESLKRRVALKVLPFHSLGDPRSLERFRREAQAAARLHHGAIVPVHDFGEHGGVFFYSMQMIDGRGLDAVVRELGRRSGIVDASDSGGDRDPLTSSIAKNLSSGIFEAESAVPEPRPPSSPDAQGRSRPGPEYHHAAARIGREVALALHHAHAQGIIHRDVKPSNVLIDAGGKAWVTDFGLAKDQKLADLTESGEFVGTLRYMAPERFREGATVASDIYGLGLTLYELLALRPAFDEPDRQQLIRKVMEGTPPPLSRHDPALPRDLQAIVHRAVAREPEDRYASSRELAAEFERFLGGSPIIVRRRQPIVIAKRSLRRNRAAWITVAAVLVVTGAVTTWLVTRSAGAPRSYPIGPGAHPVIAFDADGDKDLDLTAAFSIGKLSVLNNRGNGTYDEPVVLKVGAIVVFVAPLDVESDGKLDLVATTGLLNSVAVFRNHGGGSFSDPESWDVGEATCELAGADLDGDGDQDLAVTALEKGSVWVLWNDDRGKFERKLQIPVRPDVWPIIAADLEPDGDVDLIVTYRDATTRTITVIRNRGDGSFERAEDLDVGFPAYGCVAVDLNGDGILDLAAADHFDEALLVLQGSKGGRFAPVARTPVGAAVQAAATADFDGDGKPDLALAGGQSDLLILRGKGDLTFSEPARISVPGRPGSMAAGDLDGDGAPDLVVSGFESGDVTVLFNRGGRFQGR